MKRKTQAHKHTHSLGEKKLHSIGLHIKTKSDAILQINTH